MDTVELLPLELWEHIFSCLSFDLQHELSSMCKLFCKAACPFWIEVAPPGEEEQGAVAAALDPWVKPSLVEALATFRRFRAKHPRRLFQIRLSAGVHDSGFVDTSERPRVVGEGVYSGLKLQSGPSPLLLHDDPSAECNWDGLHIQSAEFVAVCGTHGVTSITLLEGLQEIGNGAFVCCDHLTTVTLPQGLQTIGRSAFKGCERLTSVTFPEGLQEIGDEAFCYCISLTSVTLPQGLQRVGHGAFDTCRRLTSVTFPEGLRDIGSGAFQFCSGLTSVTLPQGLHSRSVQLSP
jgi:hypothetical protein